MNVDSQFSHTPFTAAPIRPATTPPEQASARPVERPQQDPAANNQTNRENARPNAQNDSGQAPRGETRIRQESELSAQEKRELQQLKTRDREVRAHEAAHKNAAGTLAQGSASFTFETGPDGRRYAAGGEVSIDTSKVAGDPQATLRKAQTIRQAANAPAQPSAQDRQVAAQATQLEAEARAELIAQQNAQQTEDSTSTGNLPNAALNNPSQPARIGELLDVIA